MNEEIDRTYMRLALGQAELAARLGETPIGAVLVQNNAIISFACNRREIDKNPLAHAELLAIQDAAKILGGWRIPNATLYVTLEPCAMCAGAIINARIDRVVFGAYNAKAGSLASVVNLAALSYNHHPEVVGGVCEEESIAVLQTFFRRLRSSKLSCCKKDDCILQ